MDKPHALSVLRGPLGRLVRNVRVGFATNSSSLHSLAVWTDAPGPANFSERFYPTGPNVFFGEEDFRLQTEGHKRTYMAAALNESLGQGDAPASLARERMWAVPREERRPFVEAWAEVWPTVRDAQRAWEAERAALLEAATGYRYVPKASAEESEDTDVNTDVNPDGDEGVSPGVDGHSTMNPPRTYDGRGAHFGFFRALTDCIATDDRVVILGGVDNYTPGINPAIAEGTARVSGRLSDAIPQGIARYDDELGCWVVFNPGDGTKVHMDLSCPVTAPPKGTVTDEDAYEPWNPWAVEAPRVATVPQLLDVSVTDFCDLGCPYCYRGSVPTGSHADTGYLRRLAAACGEAQVFEVALGGGEPTEHPDFVEILRAFRVAGVMPNFTTRNVDFLVRSAATRVPRGEWLNAGRFRWMPRPDRDDEDKATAPFSDLFGAFAVSVDSAEDAENAAARLEELYRHQFCFQYVVGQSNDASELAAILRVAMARDVPVTLLGFKHTGRGAAWGDRSPEPAGGASGETTEPWWVPIVAEVRAKAVADSGYAPRIGIDTVLARQGGAHLAARGLDPRCLVPNEGVFSAFVNAVSQTMHTSSYDNTRGVPLAFDHGDEGNDRETMLAAWTLVRNGGAGTVEAAGKARHRSLPVVRS